MAKTAPSDTRYAVYLRDPRNEGEEKTCIASCYVTDMVPNEDARDAAIDSAKSYYADNARHTVVVKQQIRLKDRAVMAALEPNVYRTDGRIQATIIEAPIVAPTLPVKAPRRKPIKKQAPRLQSEDLTAKIAARIAAAKIAAPATSIYTLNIAPIAAREIAAFDDSSLLARYAAKHRK